MRLGSKDMRLVRKSRIRKVLKGTPDKPRLSVYRGNKNIYIQIIDDTAGRTLVSVSSFSSDIRSKVKGFTVETAKELGSVLAEEAKRQGITKVVFDRGGYKYHGKIKALADAARAGGLEF